MATAAELADFMDAVNYDYVDNYNPSNNDPLLNEVQMLFWRMGWKYDYCF